MLRRIALLGFLITEISVFGQSVIFLHHSTGGNLYTEGNVAGWIANYNSTHGTNYQITERAYPDSPYPWENYPYDYWNLWINNQCSSTNLNIQCLGNIVQSHDVIIYKHCFPGAGILPDDGNPLVSSPVKTLANYKLQYRALRSLMDQFPQKKFILWTLAPLHRLATDPATASRAKQFVDWVKTSWLTEDGKSHPNIYIFDFFGNVAELNSSPVNGLVNCLKYDYEGSHTDSDSHPNLLANQTVGPVFARFIVNTIQNQLSGTEKLKPLRSSFRMYPNPSSFEMTVDISEFEGIVTSVELLDLLGKKLIYRDVKGENLIRLETDRIPSGFYLISVRSDNNCITNRISVLH